jgi:hypothetical protein
MRRTGLAGPLGGVLVVLRRLAQVDGLRGAPALAVQRARGRLQRHRRVRRQHAAEPRQLLRAARAPLAVVHVHAQACVRARAKTGNAAQVLAHAHAPVLSSGLFRWAPSTMHAMSSQGMTLFLLQLRLASSCA